MPSWRALISLSARVYNNFQFFSGRGRSGRGNFSAECLLACERLQARVLSMVIFLVNTGFSSRGNTR